MTDDELAMIDDLAEADNLSDWELGYLDSLLWLSEDHPLTDKQHAKLAEIHKYRIILKDEDDLYDTSIMGDPC